MNQTYLRRTTQLLAVSVLTLSLLELAQWYLPLPVIITPPAMSYVSAVGLILCSVAILLSYQPRHLHVARILAGLCLAIATAELAGQISKQGLDQWLTLLIPHGKTVALLGMSPNAAFNLLLTGLALLFICRPATQQARTALLPLHLAIAMIFLCITALLGNVLHDKTAEALTPIQHIAPTTGTAFIAIAIALMLRHAPQTQYTLQRQSFYLRQFQAFSCVLLLLVSLGLLSLDRIYSVSSLIENFYRHPFTVTTLALEMKVDTGHIHRHMRDVILFPAEQDVQRAFLNIDRLDHAFMNKLALARTRYLGPATDFAAVTKHYERWRHFRDESRRLWLEGKHEEYARRTTDDGRYLAMEVGAQLDKVINFAHNRADFYYEQAIAARNDTLAMITLSIVMAILLSAIIAIAITRNIAQQLAKLRDTMLDIAGGNTMRQIPYTDYQNEMGDIARSVEVFRGQTVQLTKQEERFRQVVEMAPQGLIMVNDLGIISMVNTKAEQLFGYTRNELVGLPLEQLIPERLRRQHVSHRKDYANHRIARKMGGNMTLPARRKDGSEFNVDIGLSPVETSNGLQVLSSIEDVTAREQNRLALEEAKRVAEEALLRQREIQNELVQAEKMAALGGLVAGVAHEINTPVGLTLTSATHLETETRKTAALYENGELTEDDLHHYFATATEACRRMTFNSQRAANLIQSFKQVAVDQTGDEQRQFDLGHYIDEVLLSLQPHLKKTRIGISVSCPENLSVNSLPGALSQVLTNLVMNSVSHAFAPDEAGQITITAQGHDNKDDWIELVYTDNGHGIPPELHGKVFEPFYTTKRGSGGSGLGLHILYNLVTQKLKGRIALTSATGQGTTFTLHFPRILERPRPENQE